MGKSLGTDLECGKLTLPLIRLVSTLDDESRERLRSVILDDGIEDRRARLREEFDLGPSLDESFQCADDYIRDALVGLEALPDTSAREGLRGVAEFVLCRKR